MTAPKDQYAVFGNPVAHSKSPRIHALFAEQTYQDLEYKKILVERGHFSHEANKFFEKGGAGLNITVPFKLDAFEFSDVLSDRAKQAGAVNTLMKMPDGKIFGDNTDGCGLVRDLTKNLKWNIKNKLILILGAGGAVRGILDPLLAEQPLGITIVNRTVEKAHDLARLFSTSSVKSSGYDDVEIESFDLIINGSSASLSGDLPPINTTGLRASTCCYDMMYSKNPTVFMDWAISFGSKNVSDGLGMLVEQAAESFTIWRGVKPNTKSVIEIIRKEL